MFEIYQKLLRMFNITGKSSRQ